MQDTIKIYSTECVSLLFIQLSFPITFLYDNDTSREIMKEYCVASPGI